MAAAVRKLADARYTEAGPLVLSRTPPAPDRREPKGGDPTWGLMRNHLEARLSGLRMYRDSWLHHWAQIAAYLNPRRSTWLTQGGMTQPAPNSMTRGRMINQNILDSTGTDAMQVCAAGMMSGLTSPSRPWFKLKPALEGAEADADAMAWFEVVQDRMYQVMAGSNFYDSFAQMFEDLTCIGTSPVIIYEDVEDVIRCYVPVPGEYMISVSSANRAESLYRQFLMTISAIVEMFGIEACPPDVQGMWRTKGGSLEVEKIIAHAIEPNFPLTDKDGEQHDIIAADFPWREVYWVWGASDWQPLSVRGFREPPHIVPRWATTSNDAYGRSPGMKCLGDLMQLQVMTERQAEAIEKIVRPPLLADNGLKNQPSSILPGHVTYVQNLAAGSGMRPIYEVPPQLSDMSANMEAIRNRLRIGFYNDLFMMLSQMEGVQPRNELEIIERRNEKMQVLGPVIERFQNEAGSPAIKRIYRIMERKGLFPPLPESLQGVLIEIEYVSMLALAQRAAATAGVERWVAFTGNIAAARPEVLDIPNFDQVVRGYADMVSVPSRDLNAETQVAQGRKQRAQQQAAQAAEQRALALGSAAVQGAKTLSETTLGGGRNALEVMTGA